MSFRDKFGRHDPDLSPRHDAIMWWVDEQLRNGKIKPPENHVLVSVEWEIIIPLDSDRGRFPVAFADLLATYQGDGRDLCRVGLEIKPNVYSIGEVLRQLRTYKNLEPKILMWIVASPANELAEKAVRREGFGWLTVPDGVT